MGISPVPVLLDTANFPSDPVVVMVGISLVFLILLLLTYIITLQGKIFDRLEAKRKAASAAKSAEPAAPANPPEPTPVLMVEDGIPPEVVAVIAAAVASMDGGKYRLRALARAKDGRGAWGLAGVKSDTEPF